jgi:hypothetical protein
MVHVVIAPPADPDDPFVFDRDLDAATVGAQHTRGRHPPVDTSRIDAVGELAVDALRPRSVRAM